MISGEIKPMKSTMELLPHQAELVEAVLAPESSNIILLHAGLGLGKSTALATAVVRLLHNKQTARALFIAPTLTMQTWFIDKMRKTDTPVLGLDRYVYREILDSDRKSNIWPQGSVVVMSHRLFMQGDISDSLATISWDLIIIDDFRDAKKTYVENLRKVGRSSARIVLATSDLHSKNVFQSQNLSVIEWPATLAHDHKLTPSVVLHEIPFSLSESEVNLRAIVGELLEMLDLGSGTEKLRAMSIFRSLESSPVALENTLQNILQSDSGLICMVAPIGSTDKNDVESDAGMIERNVLTKAVPIIESALMVSEEIDADSKLIEFDKLIGRLTDNRIAKLSICVITDYVSTLYYLAAEIERYGIKCHILHGRIPSNECGRIAKEFANEGGILLTTVAQLQGVELSDVTDLVLYDAPASNDVLYLIMSRFTRLDKEDRLNMHVMVPPVAAEGPANQNVARIKNALMRYPSD